MSDRKIGVRISPHAKDRFRERFPEEAERRDVHALIYGEVQSAIANGRKSCNRPRWLSGDGHPRHKFTRKGTMRFCWNEQRTRCYAIVRRRGTDGRADEFHESWEVWTVMKPGFFESRHRPALQSRQADGRIGVRR